MADTFGVGQVDKSDAVGGEKDAIFSVGVEGPKREAFAAKGLRNFPEPTLEADIGLRRGDAAG